MWNIIMALLRTLTATLFISMIVATFLTALDQAYHIWGGRGFELPDLWLIPPFLLLGIFTFYRGTK